MDDRAARQAAEQLGVGARPAGPGVAPAAGLRRRADPTESVSCRLGDASCAGAHASTLRRSTGGVPRQAADSVLRLQREYGNHFVQRVVGVVRRAAEGEEVTEGGTVPTSIERRIDQARGGGQPLEPAVRARMEPAFGADLSGVRVHTGTEADHLSHQLSARAFTTGSDIFFRQGEYAPASAGGRELLAHELTHVAQQGAMSGTRGTVQGKLTLGAAKDPAEDEADQMARQVMRQEATGAVRRQADGVIRRLVGETRNIESLRKLLGDGDEKGAIDLMGRLDEGETGKVLANRELKELAISAFDNGEMYRAAVAMAPHRASLYQLLQWMFDEGTDWGKVKNVIPLTVVDLELVRSDNWIRDQFVGICNNKEMAEAVHLLNGKLVEKLDWMIAEGTSDELVYEKIRRAPDAELEAVRKNEKKVLDGLKSELSGEGFRRAQQMLQGLLQWEDVDKKVKEQHYEQKAPGKPWKLDEFSWKSRYEIQYKRTELRLIVRIQLTGKDTTPAHHTTWKNGIDNRWNGKFHLENDHRLPLVVEPVFTSDHQHHKVEVHDSGKSCTREDMTNWCLGTTGDTAAHEFGHMVGLEDEYNLAKADYERLVGPAPAGAEPAGGYGSPGMMGRAGGAADVEGRHLRPFLNWLNAHRGSGERPYRLVAGA
jgi:hypothetical protein